MEKIINTFEDEVIVLHTTTLIRLFELGSDPVNLYMFYVKNAKIQKTNSVWASNGFCKVGLKWGKIRLLRAKKALVENEFIEVKVAKDKLGRVSKYYVKLHYLSNNQWSHKPPGGQNHRVDRTTGWCQDTNALDKKVNALDKKVNALDKKKNIIVRSDKIHNKIFVHWNKCKIQVHKNFTSTMKSEITKALKLLPPEKIKEAITNYSNVLHDPNSYFDYKWTLSAFLNRGNSSNGQTEGKGYWQFLSEEAPAEKFVGSKNGSLFRSIRINFEPITVKFNVVSPLDTQYSTYMGVGTDKIKEINPSEVLKDVKKSTDGQSFEFYHMVMLEEAIITIIFTKDNSKLPILRGLLDYHSKWKEPYRLDAKRYLNRRLNT